MNAVITSFFTNNEDPQRGVKWDSNIEALEALAKSCNERGYTPIVLNDCFEPGLHDGMQFVTAHIEDSPYFGRWLAQHNYLMDHPEIKNAYFVDATDVVMLHDPFYDMQKGLIYVGDEFDVVGNQWLLDNSGGHVNEWVQLNKDVLLLNCGVVGGSRRDLIEICRRILTARDALDPEATVEMPIFNMVMRTCYNNRIVRGRQVTTVFKMYETKSEAWFKHK